MMLIGIDPHKSSHTATAVDPTTNSDLGSVRIDASFAGYRKLLAWARQWPERRWAVENAEGLGHHLALWLVAMGEMVVDLAPAATARARQLSRGGRRKNDRASYKARDFARSFSEPATSASRPTPRHNGKVERYNRILAEEFFNAREWNSDLQRREALQIWNIHYNYHRPHTAAGNQPPASCLPADVTNITASYS